MLSKVLVSILVNEAPSPSKKEPIVKDVFLWEELMHAVFRQSVRMRSSWSNLLLAQFEAKKLNV